MKTKTRKCALFSLILSLFLIPDVYASSYVWNQNPGFNYGPITIKSDRWVTDGYWDVKGFQWNDPGNNRSSGFWYDWSSQSSVLTVWGGDWEHDWEGTTCVGVRQGSVWNIADPNTPWYDNTTYQPTPLQFTYDKLNITLYARVRIDNKSRDLQGWMNYLFNPWFKVESWYYGVWKERRIVWDIVWAYDDWLGHSRASTYVDSAENFHFAYLVPEMAQVGEWKYYVIDLLDMAYLAKNIARDYWAWLFDVEDLYLWSIDALVEGYAYNTKFSVDSLYVQSVKQSGGGGPYCPFVSVWDGNGFVADNNVLPASVLSNGSDVEDYYRLEMTPVQRNGKYSFLLSEFANDHSYFDQVKLMAVDHEADVSIAVAPDGEILTYRSPTPPISAVDNYGNNRLNEIRLMDGNVSDQGTFFQGYPDDYLVLNFGQVNSAYAKLILRDDQKKADDQCILVQLKDGGGVWQTVETLIPRAYWSIEAVNLSPYVVPGQELLVRLYWKQPHRLDYAGLDTTQPSQYDLRYANMVSATHSTQGDVKPLLTENDNHYVELIPGQQIQLEFTLPNNQKEARTYIFYSKGHYFTVS